MGENNSADAGRHIGVAGSAIGLLVFLAGVVMVVMVFSWGHALFQSIDGETFAVSGSTSLAPDQPNVPGDVASAQPGGPSLASIGITYALKFLALLVLGWLGAMVASRGAEMTISGRSATAGAK